MIKELTPMSRFKQILLFTGCASMWIGAAHAQFGRGTGWSTTGGDAQRSSWIRGDAKISVDRVAKGGFGLAWKVKVPGGEPAIATTLDSYIGYRGFRSYAVTGTISGQISVIDTDLGRIEWTKTIPGGAVKSSPACSTAMTATVVRQTFPAFPAMGAPAGRGGRGGPAKSAVGEAGEGAVIIQQVAANTAAAEAARGRGAAAAGRGAAAAGRGAGAPGAGRGAGRPIEHISVVGADGMYHQGYISNGEEPAPALQFVPTGAVARDLAFVEGMAYAATSGGCGGAPNAVWAADPESKQVVQWSPPSGDIAGGGFAFGPDAKVYVATTTGDLVALDPKKLEAAGVYRGGQPFSGSPVIFDYKGKTMIAAPTADGHIHLVDAAGMTGSAFAGSASGPLGYYQDASGGRWIIADTKDSVTAWKVADHGDVPALESGWTTPIASPHGAIVMNGVVFAISDSPNAVLHALDGATGKELWDSGKTMTAATKTGGVSGSASQVYVGTSDGTLYAFAFPIEH
jgi:outer membrane protein assembly factor BamB